MKIVVNKCYGGFSLLPKAQYEYCCRKFGKENDVDVMYTFHPGEPLKPSTLAADGSNEFGFKVGNKITVEDAIAAGFKTVKAEE